MNIFDRYNDFKHDPFSRCNCTPPYSATNAIAARSDLNLPNGIYPFSVLGYWNEGAYDCKVWPFFSYHFGNLSFISVAIGVRQCFS